MITKEQLKVSVRTTRSGRILEIAPDDYRELPPEDAQHCELCEVCYHYFDRRRLEQVIFHSLLRHQQDDEIMADCEATPDGEPQEGEAQD